MPNESRTTDLIKNSTHTSGRVELPSALLTERTNSYFLTEEVGWLRSVSHVLGEAATDLHWREQQRELRSRTADRVRATHTEMLNELYELGFSWRNIAKMLNVSVPAVQKWRRGEGVSGAKRKDIAQLLALCDMVSDYYMVRDVASWFEVPILDDAPVTPVELYAAQKLNLVLDYAAGNRRDPESILSAFNPGWREDYSSDFEVFEADDGELSIRPKDE